MRYSEKVQNSRVFTLILLTVIAALIAAGLWMLLAYDNRGVGLALIIVGLVLALAGWVFRELRIEVGEGLLRARYGPFDFTVPGDAIVEAHVAPYHWLAYGGWGIRWSRQDGQTTRARSVPFLCTGVTVEAQSERRYYLTSRRPGELAEAINWLAGEARRP